MTYKMIEGDLFTAPKENYFAHCISADFALGAGIAVQFQNRYGLREKLRAMMPERDLQSFQSRVGSCVLLDNVFNLITKPLCWDKPTYEDLQKSLIAMREMCVRYRINYVAMPQIGCGLDRLEWPKIEKLIREIFAPTNVNITIYYLPGKNQNHNNG